MILIMLLSIITRIWSWKIFVSLSWKIVGTVNKKFIKDKFILSNEKKYEIILLLIG